MVPSAQPQCHTALKRMERDLNGMMMCQLLGAELHPTALLWAPPRGQGGQLCPGCPVKNISGVWGGAILPPEPRKHLCLAWVAENTHLHALLNWRSDSTQS